MCCNWYMIVIRVKKGYSTMFHLRLRVMIDSAIYDVLSNVMETA